MIIHIYLLLSEFLLSDLIGVMSYVHQLCLPHGCSFHFDLMYRHKMIIALDDGKTQVDSSGTVQLLTEK